MMVCGNVLGKAKTTKVGMVWYEFNIVNESMNESMTEVGMELLGQLKMGPFGYFKNWTPKVLQNPLWAQKHP